MPRYFFFIIINFLLNFMYVLIDKKYLGLPIMSYLVIHGKKHVSRCLAYRVCFYTSIIKPSKDI